MITKDPIAATAEQKKQDSFRKVMPEADTFTEVDPDDEGESFIRPAGKDWLEVLNNLLSEEGFDGVTMESCTLARTGDDPVGAVWIITSHEGYAGDIMMAVGVKDHQVTGVTMLSIGETTGLGMEARDNPAFTKQYEGKAVNGFTVVKGETASDSEIQAITGATITSKAVTKAVNAVLAADRLTSDSEEAKNADPQTQDEEDKGSGEEGGTDHE